MKNYLLLMMGGSGTRLGADIPKQYIEVNDIPIFAYILKKYDQLPFIDRIIVVSHRDWFGFVEEWAEKLKIKKLEEIAPGGATRSGSVKNGLTAAGKTAAPEDIMLLHDATHPYVDGEGTLGVIEGVKKYGGATLGGFQYDTVYQMDEETHIIKQVLPRKEVVSGASPEAFKFGDLFPIYDKADEKELESMTSAGAIALAHGIQMEVVQANTINLKITYKNDMEAFKKTADAYFFEGFKEIDD
ncbi:MAG: 2-C-methyl-D-erythritol 4-phosphate cytidylyltransferase [Eubacteriaceae bacterium]|nr:2-C-methyl-D-erythritol 4-phosphate cytidylyltransferase [Eubacteriaceae bacterium]